MQLSRGGEAVALVRVYCGLASADESARAATAAQLTIAVVDVYCVVLGLIVLRVV
jgi:hypothetical protein